MQVLVWQGEIELGPESLHFYAVKLLLVYGLYTLSSKDLEGAPESGEGSMCI